MNDRELLGLAAKAAGISAVRCRLEDPLCNDFLVQNSARNKYQQAGPWNPLTDDGDALRLAVKLGITLFPNESDEAVASLDDDDGTWIVEDNNNDEYAAMRRAIVRAAAVIGKRMA